MKAIISLSTRVNVPSVIMYHGTSSTFLRTILKKGLVPSKQKVWDADKYASFVQIPRTSLPGIYMTRNLMTAVSSSTNATKKFGGDSLYVVLNIQPKSLIVDEDEIIFTLQGMLANAIRQVFGLNTDSERVWIYLRACRVVKADAWKKLMAEFLELIKVAYGIRNTNPFSQFVYSLVDYKFAFGYENLADYYKKTATTEWRYERNGQEIDAPNINKILLNKAEAEQSFVKAMEAVTEAIGDNLYRQYLSEDRDGKYSNVNRYNGRLKQGVGYSGKNRILAVVLEHDRRNRDFDTPIQLELVYGNSLPQDFLTQYSERMGANFVVTKNSETLYTGGES